MCGIAGYWDWRHALSAEALCASVRGMTQSLRHRGPDSGALWIERGSGMALGHRRLAIRDLSPLGHQPMASPDGRYVLVYNGELYNTRELAAELAEKGIRPGGSSDTEILLLALMRLGIDQTLDRLLGMFAFGLWDRRERRLTLARDRFGVKPLYWTEDGGRRLLFASEPQAMFEARDWQPDIDHDAVALYMRYGCIPAPWSVWRGLHKLEPAHRLDMDAHGGICIRRYWDALAVAVAGLAKPLDMNGVGRQDAEDEFDALLTDAVSRRMVSDVPLGAFLSGGIDSTLVTALMQKTSPGPVRTFSIGFREQSYDEAPFARAVAAHLGTEHTELYVEPRDAWALVPEMPAIYAEPFADASQIPTTILCRLARRHVSTALSGDGGDELFAGYWRYNACLTAAPSFSAPGLMARLAAGAVRLLPAWVWDRAAELLPSAIRPRNAGSRLRNFAELRLTGSFAEYFHRYYLQHFWHPDTVLRRGRPPAWNLSMPDAALGRGVALMQFLDTVLYLSADILTKLDRASMSCSLEARTPLLDHRVFALAWRIPQDCRLENGRGKLMLRAILARYVPPRLFERPKMGFGIPIGQWLTGPLRAWAESLLSPGRLAADGIFRVRQVRAIWERQLSGASNWEYQLWIVLMLTAWLEQKFRQHHDWPGLPVTWA